MTQKQIAYALALVDDVKRVRASTTPGECIWLRTSIEEVALLMLLYWGV